MSQSLKSDCIKLLNQLIAFDTTSSKSNLELINFIQSTLDKLGIEHRLTFNKEKTKANLWATIGPSDTGGIVLSGHTDVVPVAGQRWSSDPFKMQERDGRLYGRGTCDMKGFIACTIAHAAQFKARNLKVPIHFAFTYDEEVGCIGVNGLIKDICDNLPLPRAVIVGEPTSMKIIGGNKGSKSYETVVIGVDGHSSLPQLGANAIRAANKIIAKLVEIEQRLIEHADPSNGFVPPYSSLDLGLISGGTAANIIPARCVFTWGFRTLPHEDMNAIEKEVLDFISQQVESELKAISDRASITTTVRGVVPALQPDERSAAEQLVRHLSRLNESGRVSYGTEAGQFQNAGIPGVIFGPGSIEQAHLPDEYIDISQMHECSDFLTRLGDWAERDEQILN